MSRKKNSMRRWIIWMIAIIWSGTATTVLIVSQIHPTTVINATLIVSEVPLVTETNRIVASTSEDELLISRISLLQIQGAMQVSTNGGPKEHLRTLDIRGDVGASCTFYSVRSDSLQINPPTLVTLSWIQPSPQQSSDPKLQHAFALISHEPLSGNLTSQPNSFASDIHSGFTCTRIRSVGAQTTGTVDGEFPSEGGNSIHFSTLTDARVDFRPNGNSEISDTTILAKGDLRFSRIDPASRLEKTVLIQPPPNSKNSLLFEKVDKRIDLDLGDMLLIRPGKEFYIREFVIDNGVQLSLHGPVKDVQVGAGPKDLGSRMPSLLDEMVHDKEYYILIPALAAMIIAILEKIRVLPSK